MLLTIDDLRRRARRRLPRAVFDFIDGGAEDELTLRRNESAFKQITFRPRVLVERPTLPDLDHPAVRLPTTWLRD